MRIVDLGPRPGFNKHTGNLILSISAVIFPRDGFRIAKTFWQHTGEGISSRRAEIAQKAFETGLLVERDACRQDQATHQKFVKGPRRYRRKESIEVKSEPFLDPMTEKSALPGIPPMEGPEYVQFVEERFGRNLDLSLAASAKMAIRRRIAGSLTANVELDKVLELTSAETIRRMPGFSVDDVHLYPTGMSSIFNTHRTMMAARGQLKSICFG